jgi:hypothetical protein
LARTSNSLQPVSCGNLDGTDRRNCTVRALSNATDMPIWEAKALLEKHGRKHKKGVLNEVCEGAYTEAGLTFIGWFGTTKTVQYDRANSKLHNTSKNYKGMSLETFCTTFNRGSYVVIVRGHALCVRGGKIIDTFAAKGGASVVCAWKV